MVARSRDNSLGSLGYFSNAVGSDEGVKQGIGDGHGDGGKY